MSSTNADLLQVSALFNDCIAMVRSRPAESLDRAAEDWLKEARCEVMRKIEKSYDELSQTANDILRVPPWAVDPTHPLQIFTATHSCALDQYSEVFMAEISKLLLECGFEAEVSSQSSNGKRYYFIKIFFPGAVPLPPQPQPGSQVTSLFDSLPKFSATVLRITQVGEPAITSTSPDENS